MVWDEVFEAFAAEEGTQLLAHSPSVLPSIVVAILLVAKEDVIQYESAEDAARGGLFISGQLSASAKAVVNQAKWLRDPMSLDPEKYRAVKFREGPLGIILGKEQEGLCVRKFQYDKATGKMMQAEESGMVKQGDILYAINGAPVSPELSPQELVQFLLRLKRPLVVSFRPPTPQQADPYNDPLAASFVMKPNDPPEPKMPERPAITATEDGSALPIILGEVYEAILKVQPLPLSGQPIN